MTTHRVAKLDMCEPSDERAAAVAANDNIQRDAHPISFVPAVLAPAPATVVRAGLRDKAHQPEPASHTGEAVAGLAGLPVPVVRGRGKRSAQTTEALAERDRLLRAMAARFFGGMSLLAQARHVHVELSRYASSAWMLERVVDECPQRHLGRVREFAWHILRTRDYIPSVRALRRTLADKPF